MQTFLPYKDFQKCAKSLDYRRLGKQRVETLQILKTLNGESKGWENHPAVLMWEDYLEALVEYGVTICQEWINRGYRDSCLDKILAHSWGDVVVIPHWLTDEFCLAHQSNLVRKDPLYYRPLFPDVPDNLPYIWPTHATESN